MIGTMMLKSIENVTLLLREESLHSCYSRWTLNEQTYSDCLLEEGHELEANINLIVGGQTTTLVKRFLMSLDQVRFGEQVNNY